MSKPRFHIAIKNEASSKTLELYFLDYIYDGFDWSTYEYINMVADTISQVKAAAPKKIKLTIDSQGGDAGIGLAIYNFLKAYDAEVETDVIGMAGSIASVMAMAADKGKLRMARNSFMVIHRAWGYGSGNSEDLRAAADVIDKYTGQVVDVYHQRTGKPVEDINALIANGDYWMTGEEAVAAGFADETYNENSDFKIAARIGDLAPAYRNIPKNLAEQPTPEPEKPASILSHFKTEIMKIVNDVKTAFAGLKKPATPTPAAEVRPGETTPATPAPAADSTVLLEGIENALTPIFTKIENAVTALEPAEGEASFREQLATANSTIKQLQEDVANLAGGKAIEKPDNKNEAPAIGAFVD